MLSIRSAALWALVATLVLCFCIVLSGCKGSGTTSMNTPPKLDKLTRMPSLKDAPVVYNMAGCGTPQCHGGMTTGGGAAPSLATIGSRHDFVWIGDYIRDPKKMNPKATMPAFGDEAKYAYGNIQAIAGALALQK
jgi:hypothetical protein